jgi:hypothetical protein
VEPGDLSRALTAAAGPPLGPSVATDSGGDAIVGIWLFGEIEVALTGSVPERRLRSLWRSRQANRAVPLLVIAPMASGAMVIGPRGDEPARELSADVLLQALSEVRTKPRREAAAALTDILERRDRTGIPGVVIRGLLTKHVLTRRLRQYRPADWALLSKAANKVRSTRPWRENLTALGYQAEELPDRGYLLRFEDRPVAVVLPLPDPGAFSRVTEDGALPEGVLVADCRREGVDWGLLASEGRFRLFPASTPVGAATGRFLELDITETDEDDWPYIGLLAPESLLPGGLLERLLDESATMGNELRDNVERQFREAVLPTVARGIGDYVAGPPRGRSLTDPDTRRLIEDASLLLLFRILFFLYLESRGYLPLASASYRPHSATQLLSDARTQFEEGFDARATTYSDRLVTLVRAMRTGSTGWGLPAYNGDLFAADALQGAQLLEEASLADASFGPALAALAFDPEVHGNAGVDYGDLEISHLGRIYEGLLSLRLSIADEALMYDPGADRFVPAAKNQQPEVAAGELFYQTMSGGRKAAGVYYTPQILVRHLVDHAVMPALEQHLVRVGQLAQRHPAEAARVLFDFRVLDPAMGSAHFLTDALDRIAERIGTFLADRPLKPVIKLLDALRAEARWEGKIEDGDLLRRLVVKQCLFGVDLSGMAVEVAKVSLWLASFVPGLSLTYLGHNLRKGDALVGVADPQVLSDLGPMFALNPDAPIPQALEKARQVASVIAAGLDRTPDEVEASRDAERQMTEINDGLVRVFNVWCSEPFGASKARGWLTGAAAKVLADERAKGDETYLHPAMEMARERSFFHWPAEFPEIFVRERDDAFTREMIGDAGKLFTEGATLGGQLGLHEADASPRPGFDVVIGNPPWDEVNIEELGFFALHDPGLRGLRTEKERQKRVDALCQRFPALRPEFDKLRAESILRRSFFGSAGGYTQQGAGNLDLYELFTERYGALVRTGGWLGVVLPRSAFLAYGSRGFRRWLFGNSEVRGLDFILNAGRWAFDMEARYTIALVTAERVAPEPETKIRLSGPSASRDAFERASGGPGVLVRREQVANWTPSSAGPSFEVPLLPTQQTVPVFDKMRGGPTFAEGYEGSWSCFPVQGDMNETTHKARFRYRDGVPVWKGRCFDQYDPHGDNPVGFARRADTLEWLQTKRTSNRSVFKGRFSTEYLADASTHPFCTTRVAFRDVSRATDSRTVRACFVPPETFLTNSAPYLVFDEGGSREQAFVLGLMNSVPFDWQARRFVETHLNFFLLDLLRLPVHNSTDLDAIAERAARLSCQDDRFTEFAASVGVDCGPLQQNEAEQLLAEIDALVVKAYGLDADDLDRVFSDFTESAVSPARRALIQTVFEAI